MKINLLHCYKRCEDIFLDKYHVILPELQWHKTAHVLWLHSQALLGCISVNSKAPAPPTAASLATRCGAALWRRQGGQLHHQKMRRAEQGSCRGSSWGKGKGREKNVERNCCLKERNSRGKKGKMSEKNWEKKKR